MKRAFLLLGSLALFLSLVIAWGRVAQAPRPVSLTPSLTGQPEYCLTCHADLPEISPSHPVKTFGCVICHGGERLALDANLAHSTLRGGANPSDLSVVEQSCGGANCHSGAAADEADHIQRVMTGIQATYTGAITSIRYTFGVQSSLTPLYGIMAVTDTSLPSKTGILHLDQFDPAAEANSFVQAFGKNCLTCHLSAQPVVSGQYQRYTGCAACHTPTPLQLSQNSTNLGGETDGGGAVHTLTTAIPYTQCDICHNRGNYDLRTMTFVERADQPTDRLHDYYQPIAQFTQCEYTLDCVDCHTRTEAMGDGDIHANEADMQYIQCKTCHGTPTELPLTKTLTDPNDIAFRLAFLNPITDLKLGDTLLVTEQGEPLWNTLVLPDGTYQLVGKATKQVFIFRPVLGSGCTQNGQDQSSAYCHTCHSVSR
jgi:hypothetical protein